MAEIVLSIASKVAEYLVAPFGRQCGYMMFTNSYVGKLKEEIVQLENARQRVQHSVDEARNNMKRIEADVEEWMKKVETVANKARDVLDYDGRAKETCFYRWLPNPKERYSLGRSAKKTVQAIQALIPQGKFERVYYESTPPGFVGGAPEVNSSAGDGGEIITDSRAPIFQGIMEALDDEKLKVIGVYGPGGVGKTTLLKEVEEKLRKEKRLFHMIVKAEVSRTLDLNSIQGQLADALSLNLKDKQSLQGRRDFLLDRLTRDSNEKVLVILDDLWEELDLKEVGIPTGEESRGCKLLLSSRFKDVLERKMHADRTFRLEGLNNDEAFRLFEKMVGDRLKDEEELKRIAVQVVKKLAGLPLLITSVASTLKYSNVSAWRNALIKIDESNIETIVRLSYDHLKSEDAKSLFLLCGLIGGTIRVEILLVLGMGLGLFERFNRTMQGARDRLNTTLDELHSACLLLDGGDDKGNVTIHDLYSEVVISTPFRGQNSLMMNNNSWSKEKLEKGWAICLTDVGSDRLAELMRCGFPDLKILMLSQPEGWRGRPDHRHVGDYCGLDFTYMKQLRVLYIRFMHIPSLPSSVKILENLRSLYLDHCNVEDVAILGKLKALQILSFAGSEISRLPKEIGELTNLRSLNLSECGCLKIIEPGTVKGLINLEELYMKGSFDKWMGKDEIPSELCNARLAELKSLAKLTALEISISDPTILLDLEDGDLPFENLIRFWINIGNVGGREFQGLRTMKLKLQGCQSILSKDWVQKTLHKTQHLHLDGLREFKKSAHELCSQGFPQLKHLDIDNSPSIEYVASSSNGLPLTAFTTLESLFLENLTNLEKIWNGPVAPDCFSKLKAVRIEKCHRLKNLWFSSEMQRLVHLEEIEVHGCDSLQAIITHDVGKVEVADDYIVELPNVCRLDLFNLPKMTSFCTGPEGAPIQVSLPRLKSLWMKGLLDLEKILYSQPPLQYNNLESIRIWHSASSALSILKSDWILKLPNLDSLLAYRCQSTKVVFDLEELKVTEHVEILSQLTKLTLWHLQDLQRIWKQDVQLQGLSVFRNLKRVNVNNTGLSFLFSASVAKCLREIADIAVTNCKNMEAVIVDEEGRDGGTYDTIEFPKLERLDICDSPTLNFFSCPSGKKELVTTTSDSRNAYSDSFFNRKVSLPNLEKLRFFSVGSFKRIWHGDLPRSSLCELAILTLDNCSELLNVFPSTIVGRLHNLKEVKVSSCPSLESLFDCGTLDSTTEQTTVLLPKLERVHIKSCPSLQSLFNCGSLDSNAEQARALLPKLKVVRVSEAGRLRHVAKSDSQTVWSFPSLKEVSVRSCSELRYLFPYFTAATLGKLEKLEIADCARMEQVVPKEEGGQSKADEMSFPSLKHVTIRRCRDFGAFISSHESVKRKLGEMAEENEESPQPMFNEMIQLPNIMSLQIEGAQCKELWSNQIPGDSFCKLEFLRLEHCDNLQRIAPFHMWKRLQCLLDVLQVESCRSIEIIYEGDEKATKSGKLRRMVLRDLENLRHIWQSDGLPYIPFPNLRFIEVQSCPRLRMLFPTFTSEFLGQIKVLVVESCQDIELIASNEEREEATGTAITFSELIALRLFELPKFRSFLPEKYSAEFPSLQVLRLIRCGTEPDQGLGDWVSYQRHREFEIYEEMFKYR